VLTFLMIVLVALLSPDTTTAAALVGVFLAYACGYRLLTKKKKDGEQKEGFEPSPPVVAAHPPPPTLADDSVAIAGGPAPYPGAIDPGERVGQEGLLPEYARAGYRDARAGEAVGEGNPYAISSRTAVPGVAPRGCNTFPCGDIEDNNDEITGDERIVNNSLPRNEPTRVTAGTLDRRRMMTKYLEEEVAADESSRWWGQHEY
jgi:hypothetical protein